MRTHRLPRVCLGTLWLLRAIITHGQSHPPPAPEITARDRVVINNTGFRFLIAPGVFVNNGGNAGFSLRGYAGYGFESGPFILRPGVSIGSYFADPNLHSAVPQIRVTYPIGGLAPFLGAGAGLAYLSNPSGLRLSLFGEGGAIYYAENFGVGMAISYERFVNTDFAFFTFSPMLSFAF